MVYTEIKEVNGNKYYYRVMTIRNGKKFKKQRIYLGKDISKEEIIKKENSADKELNIKKRDITLSKIIPKIKLIFLHYHAFVSSPERFVI